MNDGFVTVFDKLKKFVPLHDNTVADFKAWLKKILVFTAMNHNRKDQRYQQNVAGLYEMSNQVADTHENQLDRPSYREIIDKVQRLSPAYGTVFSLFVIYGFGHEEISKQLGRCWNL